MCDVAPVNLFFNPMRVHVFVGMVSRGALYPFPHASSVWGPLGAVFPSGAFKRVFGVDGVVP